MEGEGFRRVAHARSEEVVKPDWNGVPDTILWLIMGCGFIFGMVLVGVYS